MWTRYSNSGQQLFCVLISACNSFLGELKSLWLSDFPRPMWSGGSQIADRFRFLPCSQEEYLKLAWNTLVTNLYGSFDTCRLKGPWRLFQATPFRPFPPFDHFMQKMARYPALLLADAHLYSPYSSSQKKKNAVTHKHSQALIAKQILIMHRKQTNSRQVTYYSQNTNKTAWTSYFQLMETRIEILITVIKGFYE